MTDPTTETIDDVRRERDDTEKSEYTRHHYARGPGLCIDYGNPDFILRDGDEWWRVEWHYYFGPCSCHKKTGDPNINQPGPKSRFWIVVQWWYDQGAKVVDGVGVWEEPPKEKQYLRRINRRNVMEVDEHYRGDDLIVIERHVKNWPGRAALAAKGDKTATEGTENK